MKFVLYLRWMIYDNFLYTELTVCIICSVPQAFCIMSLDMHAFELNFISSFFENSISGLVDLKLSSILLLCVADFYISQSQYWK